MKRDIIVYFGLIDYERENAMCQHVAGRRALINAIGYHPVIIGVDSCVPAGKFKKVDDDLYLINNPRTPKERIAECFPSNVFEKILKEIGVDRVKSLIMADYRLMPMARTFAFCQRNNINYIVDIMDRFTCGTSLVSWIKAIDSELRMKIFYPRITRRIYICSSYSRLLGESDKTAVIPGVAVETNKSEEEKEKIGKVSLVFLGVPGRHCEKEKIDWVIQNIYERRLSDRFIVYLGGVSKDEFVNNNKVLYKYLTGNIVFLGRLKHSDCIKLLKKSDISLVIRANTKLANYGFSTKIGEAFSCGIPVLATDTSDNAKYIDNEKNGFVVDCSYDSIGEILEKIASMPYRKIEAMKEHILRNNPLYYRNFIDDFAQVVK